MNQNWQNFIGHSPTLKCLGLVFTLSTHVDKHYHMLSKTLIFTTFEKKTCNQRSRGLHKGCNEAKVKVGKKWENRLKNHRKTKEQWTIGLKTSVSIMIIQLLFLFQDISFFHIVDSQSNVLEDPLLFSLFCFAFFFLLVFLFFSYPFSFFFFKTEEVNYENEIHPYTYSKTYSQIISKLLYLLR